MHIEGRYTVQAPPEHVWHSLMDPTVLLSTVPGIEKLEKLDENTYEVVIQIKHAPLKGAYHGHVTVTGQQFPRRYCIEVYGEGRQHVFSGTGNVQLDEQNNNTIVAYSGELKQEKRNALLPPAVVKGAAKLLIQQFFAALSVQLAAHSAITTIEAETVTTGPVIRKPGGTITILPPEVPQQRPTGLQTLISWFGSKDDAPQEIARWGARVRRVGMITALLFLVWVGTRIPKKH